MEKTVYIHTYSPENNAPSPQTKPGETPRASKTSQLLAKLSKLVGIAGVLFLLVSYTPSFWYAVKGNVSKVSELIAQTARKGSPSQKEVEMAYQPKFDPSLPLESSIKAPAIGLDTKIVEATAENYEEALKKGVWRVSDFGTPYSRQNPTILAAHRFGYLAWSNLFRRKSSFYNLPKLEEGDTVEIVWRQRKYIYEVYASDKGEEITDYSADLILYTCENLNSKVRIFKYLRLLEV